MQADPDQLLQDGYLIFRGLIPPDEVATLRRTFEELFDRKRAAAGDAWAKSSQRRLVFDETLDPEHTQLVDFCLDERTRGTSRRLMRAADAAPYAMNSLCNPAAGAAQAPWHRDVSAGELVYYTATQQDIVANRTTDHVQWNIPLYDDNILWLIPGSYGRPNTPDEQRRLRENPRVPMPGGMAVELAAGDAVAYNAFALHWGSDYQSDRIRRTIHLAYHPFGGPIKPYGNFPLWAAGFERQLSPASRAAFEQLTGLYAGERDAMTAAYRALVDRDRVAFAAALAALHPSPKHRFAAVMLLHRDWGLLRRLEQPETAALPSAERAKALGVSTKALGHWDALAAQLSAADLDALEARFAPLGDRLDAIARRAHGDAAAEIAWREIGQLIESAAPADVIAWA